MLVLPIKKQWFDMIVSGEKKAEYRALNDYYKKRFQTIGLLDEEGRPTEGYARIILRNGYSRNSPETQVVVGLSIGRGVEKWGAEKDTVYYILPIVHVFTPWMYERVDENGT